MMNLLKQLERFFQLPKSGITDQEKVLGEVGLRERFVEHLAGGIQILILEMKADGLIYTGDVGGKMRSCCRHVIGGKNEDFGMREGDRIWSSNSIAIACCGVVGDGVGDGTGVGGRRRTVSVL
ncbi:hypothetical protein ACLOJK_031670 [Asimina triloba]